MPPIILYLEKLPQPRSIIPYTPRPNRANKIKNSSLVNIKLHKNCEVRFNTNIRLNMADDPSRTNIAKDLLG